MDSQLEHNNIWTDAHSFSAAYPYIYSITGMNPAEENEPIKGVDRVWFAALFLLVRHSKTQLPEKAQGLLLTGTWPL